MLHQDLTDRLPIKGDMTSQHLVEDYADRVNVDGFVIFTRANLGGHVVAGTDALRVLRAMAWGDELG
jgi:hypothetical protein